jgi:DNA-binding NarL/FixJ family response regulator
MPRVLLIVDDCEEISRGLRRCLKHDFDTVLTAATVADAERHLAAADAPTHLLCDFFLGEGAPAGIDLVRRWRAAFPRIVVAAVFSGAELADMVPLAGVDRIFKKPLDIEAIEAFFARPSGSS